MWTFEVVGVQLHAADHSGVTESEHGPLPARDQQDAVLVLLEKKLLFNSFHFHKGILILQQMKFIC